MLSAASYNFLIEGIVLFAPRESSLHHTRLLLSLPSPPSQSSICGGDFISSPRKPPSPPPFQSLPAREEKGKTCWRLRHFSFKVQFQLSFLLIHQSLAVEKFPLNSPSHVARRRPLQLLWTVMWSRDLPIDQKFASVCLAKAEWLLILSIFSRYRNSLVDLPFIFLKLMYTWNYVEILDLTCLLANYRIASYQSGRWIRGSTLQKFHRSAEFLRFRQLLIEKNVDFELAIRKNVGAAFPVYMDILANRCVLIELLTQKLSGKYSVSRFYFFHMHY